MQLKSIGGMSEGFEVVTRSVVAGGRPDPGAGWIDVRLVWRAMRSGLSRSAIR